MPMVEHFAKFGEGVDDRINEFAAVSFDLLAAGPLVSPPYSSRACLKINHSSGQGEYSVPSDCADHGRRI
jgi:hypothetical protein